MSAPLLKDLYNQEYVNALASSIEFFYKDFNTKLFIQDVFDLSWKQLELKQRMKHISKNIELHISLSYENQINILMQVYNHIQINVGNRKNKQGLENMIFSDFVEAFGLEYFEISMKALACFTINSSAEFAIRAFILKYEDKTINQMILWSKSDNFELRRLASEGCRSRLPWACALPKYKKDPSKVLNILEILQDDKVLYVKKSVANNLNDICKDNPNILIDIAKRWYNQNEDKNWVIKHACRTLLKQGNQEVLNIFGFGAKNGLKLNDFNINENVSIGENLDFSFVLNHKENLGLLRIEYSIDFVRLNNKTNNKVFFIAQKDFKTKEHIINKKHSFKIINTRKYYEGIHCLNIIVNGVIISKKEFKVSK